VAFLTEEEVQHYLGKTPADIQKLMKRGKLTAFRVGGSYIRFKKEEVVALKSGKKFIAPEELGRSQLERFRDFWKFYSFYVITSVCLLVFIILFFQL